ncbi:hypothetical protein TCAL_05961 [Tigriopus californicus]|uniref:Ig-like domain-containing protein n=1 Tax=Tigriopus californicus TaxID=6832 RepID=A0A553NQ99_TIGCA|nr:hypothetical protein TCAL_05961 [Tigriopus californicus]
MTKQEQDTNRSWVGNNETFEVRAWSYHHRDEKIQADINKLYDTHPTPSHSVSPEDDNIGRIRSHHHGYREQPSPPSVSDGDSVPVFDLNNSPNVTAVLDKTAILNCRVKDVGNKTVSWVRYSDTHLLTIGRLTYTSDLRFKAIHKMFSEDYLLQIKPVTHRDAGQYQCQISTTPPTSHTVTLSVAEPKTSILGGPDIHLKEGSTMNLTCVIEDSPEPPSYIFWRHNDAIISYDSPRGGVSVITEKGDTTASFLVVQHTKPSDSGTYSCSPSLGQTVSVNVHVLRGEYIGARKGTNAGHSIMARPRNALLMLPRLLLPGMLNFLLVMLVSQSTQQVS